MIYKINDMCFGLGPQSLRKKTDKYREACKDFILTPERWYFGDRLPMKKWTTFLFRPNYITLGILLKDDLSTIYTAPSLESDIENLTVLKKYDSIDSMLDDGWRVD